MGFEEFQQRVDEWNVVLQFLDARDWMRLLERTSSSSSSLHPRFDNRLVAYRAVRILTTGEWYWFNARKITVTGHRGIKGALGCQGYQGDRPYQGARGVQGFQAASPVEGGYQGGGARGV